MTLSSNFLNHMQTWQEALPTLSLAEALPHPERAALLSVDVTRGFCCEGALASPRVANIVPPVTRLMQAAWNHGLRHILLLQDTHAPDAVEFAQWPPHCVSGSPEATPVDEIAALPFFSQMMILPKNSISSDIHTGLDPWLAAHPELDTFIVVGDCTDLCTYQLAMHLRMQANAVQLQRRVLLPANCADTYDLPIETAAQIDAMPHPG
ncbi:MAG TPA: isochorismatase family cysteine hydrolase, partial [Anaerolineaceae bacterium]|nr:isochorismatase family cysteine hydrolase [Anaerolineaceae bacterium]